MWATLALAALSTAAGQAGELRLTNDRVTLGMFGPPRADTKFYPGDTVWLHFDLENAQVGPDGRVRYRMEMQVTDGKGQELLSVQPEDLEAHSTLGGSRIPAVAHVNIGLDRLPGEYAVRLTVTDRASRQKAELVRKVQVSPKGFGLVNVQMAAPAEVPVPVPPVGVVGQSLVVNFAAVGFTRDTVRRQPHIAAELRVLDEAGKPTSPRPLAGEVTQGIPEKAGLVPMQFLVLLNRPGKYTLQLRAEDRLGKRDAELSLPLTVLESAK